MNTKDHQAFRFLTNNYPPAIALVFLELYHWGTIEWNGHKSGDWFHKSIKNMSEDLGIAMKTIQRAYEIIKEGKCTLFQSEVRMKRNYPVTYFKVIEKEQELSTIYHSQKDYGTTVKKTMVPQSKKLRYHSQKDYGINIITHNNSMYTHAKVEDEIPTLDTQTEEFQKEKVAEDMTNIKIHTDDLSQMLEIWNGLIRPKEPEVMHKSLEKRLREVLTTFFDADIDKWKEHCSRIASSHFLMGDKFTLSLAWALKPEWIEKVTEGKYDNYSTKKDNETFMKTPPVKLPKVTIDAVMASCQNDIDKKVKPILYEKLGAETYATWIHHTGASFYEEEGRIQVNSCGKFIQTTIKTRFWREIESAYS